MASRADRVASAFLIDACVLFSFQGTSHTFYIIHTALHVVNLFIHFLTTTFFNIIHIKIKVNMFFQKIKKALMENNAFSSSRLQIKHIFLT
ncbi:hypothetical protein DXK91_13465 [Parageobacillus toebii]|nr:hypothetical protein CN643_02210 [Parageobacillus yumthangensis]PUF88028.1 hypothetical protein DCC82_02325 [Geobacillus sp. LYN3]RDV21553.1 hypothetical protein DXK91_13465 [Parageobacillus toebii]